MRALIVGGGIAGPAAALALAHVGIEPVVLERRNDREAAAGSYFTIAPNGLDALDLLGALDVALEHGFASEANVMYGATGRRLGELSLGRPLRDGLVALTAKRPLLAAGLREEAQRRGVTVLSDAEVTSVQDHSSSGGGVSVTLADGRELIGDLVVGADGVRSLVRRTIDPAAPAARYVGLTNFGGITRRTPVAQQLQPRAWHFVFGHHAFVGAHPTPDGDVVWFVNVPEPPISPERRSATTEAAWRERLASLVAPDAGPAAELIGAGALELAGDNTYDLPHVPHWSAGRLVLVGDAAHAPSPSSGQGASMALEDAVVLARSIRDHATTAADIPAALRAYEGMRRDRVERIVRAGARSSRAKTPGPVGRRIQEAVMPLVFRYLVTDRSTAWMTGSRLSWGTDVRV